MLEICYLVLLFNLHNFHVNEQKIVLVFIACFVKCRFDCRYALFVNHFLNY